MKEAQAWVTDESFLDVDASTPKVEPSETEISVSEQS